MQRIDENTYIDETLITCAEYQLFIDEMREKGKYYQPDHWISYMFPKGQASKPVLGVSFTDAQAFCEWLTLRVDGNWRYRLPTPNEATEYPLKISLSSRRSYWVLSIDRILGKAWINEPFIETPAYDRFKLRSRDLDLDILYLRDRVLDRVRKISPKLVPVTRDAIDRAKSIIHNVVFNSVRATLLEDIENYDQELTLNKGPRVENEYFLRHVRYRNSKLAQAQDLIDEILDDTHFGDDRSLVKLSDILNDAHLDDDDIRPKPNDILEDIYIRPDDILADLSNADALLASEINFLIDTIQRREERAAAPHFEGIRLVKERIK